MKKLNIHLVVLWCFISTIILLPFSRLSELPILMLTLIGIFALFKEKEKLFSEPRFKVLTWIFCCYLGMILLSSFDSYWQDKTLNTALVSFRFYFASIALIQYLQPKHYRTLVTSSAIICVIWSLDALIQYGFGTNLIGLSSYPGRLNGVFGEGHAKLGPVLALLFPCLLIQLISIPKPMKWFILLVVSITILLSGTRSAWLMLGFALIAFLISHIKTNKWLLVLKTLTVASILSIGLWFNSTDFQDRIERTLGVFEGSTTSLDFALANRLSIWQVSVEMFKNHPINGVGARAFREAYPDFAQENDVWQQTGGVGMHAHHWVLEVLSETGIIGLSLFALAILKLALFIRSQRQSNESWAFAVALLCAFLPIISTYSIFSSFWAICIWLIGSALITVSRSHD